MRQMRLLALAVGTVAIGTACGGGSDGGTDPQNAAPTASFTKACTARNCTFTDASTDSDGSIASRAWSFGDGGTSSETAPTHAYTDPGAFTVQLIVTDNGGAKDTTSQTVTIGGGTGTNVAPTAAFSHVCSGQDCTFQDKSADDGTIVAWSWNFGDGSAVSTEPNPTHTYAAAGTYPVSLTVTDDSSATNTISQDIETSAPAGLQCRDATTGGFASCTLHTTHGTGLRITLVSHNCTARGNTLHLITPVDTVLFTDGCRVLIDNTSNVYNIPGPFPIGTAVQAEILSGSPHQTSPPAVHVEGTVSPWTLNFDDGEDTPQDFNDLVLTLEETP